MSTHGESMDPSVPYTRLIDILSEQTGAYRITALSRGAALSLSARIKSPSRLRLGLAVVIQQGVILHCGGKAWCGFGGHIRLGDGVRIGPYCVVYGAGGVDLEDHVHLGPGVKIMSQSGRHDQHRLSADPTFKLDAVYVGAGSWVGAGAVILGGATLGRCVSVAPNAVVGGVVPDCSVVAGNPARVVFKNEPVE